MWEAHARSICPGPRVGVPSQLLQVHGVFRPSCFFSFLIVSFHQDCDDVVASKSFPIEGPDGKQHPLCERDYFRRLNLICAKCGMALRGSYITACSMSISNPYSNRAMDLTSLFQTRSITWSISLAQYAPLYLDPMTRTTNTTGMSSAITTTPRDSPLSVPDAAPRS